MPEERSVSECPVREAAAPARAAAPAPVGPTAEAELAAPAEAVAPAPVPGVEPVAGMRTEVRVPCRFRRHAPLPTGWESENHACLKARASRCRHLGPDGIVGARTQAALDGAARPRPRTPEGRLLEIDLTHQVLIVGDAGTAVAVLDISTGRLPGTTPVGRFTVTRQIDGYHRSPLGVLYRPKYFYRGVAIHGYPSVPPYPASHGCVRTINAAMDWLWSSGAAAIGTPVFVYR